MKDFQS